MKATTITKKYNYISAFAEALTEERPTILDNLEALFSNGYIRPQWVTGRGRWASLHDIRHEIRDVLNRLGIAYVEGNDAPRGGRTGDWMCLKADEVWEVKGDNGDCSHFGLQFNDSQLIVHTSNFIPAQVREEYAKMCKEVDELRVAGVSIATAVKMLAPIALK